VRRIKFLFVILFGLGAIGLGGCALQAQEPVNTSVVFETILPSSTVGTTDKPIPSLRPRAFTTPTLEEILLQPTAVVCSPLLDYDIGDLLAMVVNPYAPPLEGKDDPHQGVDIAVRASGRGIALDGNIVQAILSGRVAGVIVDRFPYGNAIIVETSYDELPGEVLKNLPEPISRPWTNTALTCPGVSSIKLSSDQKSIYVIYAHLKEPTTLEIGTPIECGQNLGLIGSTGNALNPHLHLEARTGPSDVGLPSMAHYDASATTEEMASYCLWRVSGIFQLINPLVVLGLTP